MATALYRRYRPESFSEMIGQAHVTEPLMTALRNGRIGHAYLFSGPRGCGKTTSARVLARCLNCAEGPTDTPCGVCPSCVELGRAGGGSLDVVEIDAASHGGVDDARELRERAVFAPARDRYKIFIIDEAHMVTPGGFNALLKIVEEPPPHVKFIFATTEPEKVIGTIRSRTHHYPFRLIAPGALIEYTQQLCEREGVAVEPGVLPLVVRAGGGSVRDTLSILDQLIAGSEGAHVTTERAAGLLGFTSVELLDEVVTALAAGDAAAAFHATDRVVQTGQDPRRFVEDLLERLRDLIVISATSIDGAAAVFRGVPEAQLQRMFEQTRGFARGELSRIADTVSAALDRMSGATAPRLHLELMIARALAAKTPGAAPAVTAPHAAAATPAAAAAPPAQPAPQAVPGGGSAPVAPAVPAPAPPVPPAAAPDIIGTLRSAREFLRGDGAAPAAPASQQPAAQQQPTAHGAQGVPSPAPAPMPETAPGSAPAPSRAPQESAESSASALEPVTLAELREVWSDLLEEILEQDREAWNAVRAVVPLELRDDVLTIGISSQSDLDSFKAGGAAPLREAISAAIGVTVRYVPKQLPPASAASSAERAAVPGVETPGEPGEDPDPVAARLEAVLGAKSAAPPVPTGEFGDPGFSPDRDPAFDPSYAAQLEADIPDPEEPGYPDEYGVSEQPAAPNGAASFEVPRAPEPAIRRDTAPSASPPAAPPARTFTRYGEAVVREVLGARFIEELPLPSHSDS